MTSADRIRAMTNEELEEALNDYECFSCLALKYCETHRADDKICSDIFLEWLKQEVKE